MKVSNRTVRIFTSFESKVLKVGYA